MSYKQILESRGIKEEEIKKWAKENYPQFAANIPLMLSLYLDEKGISVEAREIFPSLKRKSTIVKVGDIPNGSRVGAQLVIAKHVSDQEYTACSECWSKVNEDNECKKHGKVAPRIAKSAKFIAGDETGDTIINITPWVMNELKGKDLIGKVLNVEGILTVSERFGPEFSVVTAEFASAAKESSEEESVSETLKVEASRIKGLIEEFGEITEKELKAYIKHNKLQSDAKQIMEFLGLSVRSDGKIVSKP